MNILKKICNFLLILLTFCLISISIYLIYIINTLPKLEFNNDNNQVEILDNKGNKLQTATYFNTFVSYEDISKNMINALISIEDNNFFKHNGVSYKRMLKALFNNIKAFSFKEGASTIDQQLIKNQILSSDKTINRKVSEIILSLKLDRKYTKEQILEMYLNNILFGDNIYGIYDAALYYFNKNIKDVSIDEAATLAGMIQLPNYYNPYRNPSESEERRNIVLTQMKKNNYISETEYSIALETSISKKLSKNIKFNNESYINSYLDYLNYYGYSTSTSKIKTFMSKKIQKDLYDIASNKYNHFPDPNLQVAMVVLDNQTGGVLGILGNRSNNKMVINYALEKKQMASTMKPLVDYAPAFEYNNLSPATLITDEEYCYSDGTPLKNWDYQYKGEITLRKALRESRNIPALKIFQSVDNNSRIEFLNKLNLFPSKPIYESEALGSGENTFSLLEIVNAYSSFANEGKFIKASPIQEAYGDIYYKNEYYKRVVMKKSTSYFINSILHDVFKGSKFDMSNSFMCAKTGQTNYDDKTLLKYNIPYGSTKDSYVIAYTKNITLGIWVGYDLVSSNTYLDNYKTQIPRSIMKFIMNKYGSYQSSYEKPNNVLLRKISIIDSTLYLDDNGFYDYFVEGYEPKKYYKKKNYDEA